MNHRSGRAMSVYLKQSEGWHALDVKVNSNSLETQGELNTPLRE